MGSSGYLRRFERDSTMPNSTQNKRPKKSSRGGLHPSLSERPPTVNVDIAPLIPYLQLTQDRFAASQDAQVELLVDGLQ